MRAHLIALVAGLLLATASTASAEVEAGERKGPAATGRIELGPSVGFSLDRTLRQAILLGARLEVRLTDYLSLGLDCGYGVGLDAGLTDELALRYRSAPATWADFTKRFSTIRLAGDLRASLTLLCGKLGVFSRFFLAYDLCLFAGLAVALLTNDFEGPEAEDAVSQGLRAGPAFGLGARLFVTRYLALGAEVKNLLFADNESGGDLTRGLSEAELARGEVVIDGDDQLLTSHWFVGLRVSLVL